MNHLWGIDALEDSGNYLLNYLDTNKCKMPKLVEKLLNKAFFRNSPGATAELLAYNSSKSSDYIYSVCGPLATTRLYPEKVVAWTFALPPKTKLLSPHLAYQKKSLRNSAGFFCLTPNGYNHYKQYAPSTFVPWYVDLELFNIDNSENNCNTTPFFLATGKTERDYKTLIESAYHIKAEIRIIAPLSQKPNKLPLNVRWINSSSNPPDLAIDYPTLREWYSQCIAVCIPLSGDADDTCGYTNMLEGMAMQKPVLMTKSGCLHVNPETREFGKLIPPKSSSEWSSSMNELIKEPDLAKYFGKNGRELVESEFTKERFDESVLSFFNSLSK